MSASATDTDSPPTTLIFRLLNGPDAATITQTNNTNAVFRWRPQAAGANTVNPVTPEIRHHLVVAFKEALHNILKHSAATEAQISFRLEATAVIVSIKGNGCGFDMAARAGLVKFHHNHNGLVNMRRRLEEIGGGCEIMIQPGQGTRVTFYIPGRRAAKRRECKSHGRDFMSGEHVTIFHRQLGIASNQYLNV